MNHRQQPNLAVRETMPPRGGFVKSLAGALALLAAGCGGCGDDEGATGALPPNVAPPRGGASPTLLSTNIGTGSAIQVDAPPDRTKWERVIASSEKSITVLGTKSETPVALRTIDGGRTWNLLELEKNAAWYGWGANDRFLLGVVLAAGSQATGTIRFLGETKFSNASPFFDAGTPPVGKRSLVAVLDGTLGSIAVQGPRLAFGSVTSTGGGEPMPLPSESFVASPMGDPPQLVSVSGGQLRVRMWPRPKEKLTAPRTTRLPGSADLREKMRAELDDGASCHFGQWSFHAVSARETTLVLGVSPERTVAFTTPVSSTSMSCNADAVVLVVADGKGARRFQRCDFAGRCTEPKGDAYEPLLPKWEGRRRAAPSQDGIVAFRHETADEAWRLSLGSTTNEGQRYAIPRLVNEGNRFRGRVDLGPVFAAGSRVFVLFAADITGTSDRGWYALASDDGGYQWGPP